MKVMTDDDNERIAEYVSELFEHSNLPKRYKLLVTAIWNAGLTKGEELDMYMKIELMVKLNGIENALRERAEGEQKRIR